MANDLTCNPLVIDTAAATAILSGYLDITNIRWVDYNNDIADGDQAVVNNAASKTIWETRCTATGAGVPLDVKDETAFPFGLQVKGLIVPTLTHGKVYIYFKGPQPKV